MCTAAAHVAHLNLHPITQLPNPWDDQNQTNQNQKTLAFLSSAPLQCGYQPPVTQPFTTAC